MYDDLYYLRKKYGEVYVTVFPDETVVPWKQLSLQDFLHYSDKFASGRFPPSHVEDEIFCKCCVDETLVANLDLLEAGIITTVVTQIMEVSGPTDISSIEFDLHVARSQVQDFISDGVGLICQTFPGYKPEDLYEMDYQTFMKRLALAERRLLSMGLIREPITFEINNEAIPEKKMESISRRLVDLNPAPVSEPRNIPNRPQYEEGRHIPRKVESEGVIVKQGEMRDTTVDLGGHDLLDKALWEHDAMQGLEYIYPEYFERLKRGERITPEVINQVKGRTPDEVKNNYKEYRKKLDTGEIKPEKPNYLIANKVEGQASPNKKKVKVTVKRG